MGIKTTKNRILFASWCNNKFILLSIFMKQIQKTPKRLLEDYKKE